MKKIILIFICLILCGCENYAELNKLSIVTAAGIDKKDDKYEITLLIANSPKNETTSKEGEAKTTVYQSTGKSIAEAIKKIDKKTPKQLYFSHINVIVISEEIGKEGFFKVADWWIRHPQTRNKFYLIQVNQNKAGNVLKIVSPLESFPSQNIATLIESNKNSRSIGDTASYSNFISRVLKPGYEAIMPTIKINGNVKEGSKRENLETANPKTYLSLGPLAIYKKDKLIKTTTKKETDAIYILNNEAKELIYTINYKNNLLNIFSNSLKTKIKLKNKNEADIYIKMKGTIYETNGKIDLNNIKEIEKTWNKSLKKDLKKLIKNVQNKYQSDIFGFGNLIYKNYPQRWKQIKNNWNEKYFKKFKINIHSNAKITSTASLTKTLEKSD
ncbi:MAG: Ger(x)C family spore germination protein [Bacilli bacterium]|nr:Ger(x)C family spore germination protein [Bacilli bacterium]